LFPTSLFAQKGVALGYWPAGKIRLPAGREPLGRPRWGNYRGPDCDLPDDHKKRAPTPLNIMTGGPSNSGKARATMT
jgi:hypothetical protein